MKDEELLTMPEAEYQAYKKKKTMGRREGLKQPQPQKGFRYPKANYSSLSKLSSGLVSDFFGMRISPKKEKEKEKKKKKR